MQSPSSLINFSIEVVGPVVLLIAFGYFLIKRRFVNDSFVETGSALVFNFALPALLFINISNADLMALVDTKSISVGIGGTLVVFIASVFLVVPFVKAKTDKGVLIQGIFRANMGIIGLAYCAKAYGTQGLAVGSVYMGCMTILYNILGVAVLNTFLNQQTNLLNIAKGILTNPIIMSIVLGVSFSLLKIQLPSFVDTSLSYFSQLALPLALICTGAALKFSAFGQFWKLTLTAIIGKCIVYPFLLVAMALYFNIDSMALGIIFLMSISPTAAVSYIMVRKIGGNHVLAAQIIAFTTVASLPLTIVGFTLIRQVADIAL